MYVFSLWCVSWCRVTESMGGASGMCCEYYNFASKGSQESSGSQQHFYTPNMPISPSSDLLLTF